MKKYCPSYTGILPWINRISPSWIEWETSRPHISAITNLWRNGCILLILFIVPSYLLSHPGCYINSPLDGCSKPFFQRLIHLKDSDNLKQYKTAKNQFSNINSDLTLKNNIKLKLQKVFKLKLSFKKIPYSFLETINNAFLTRKINSKIKNEK